jgi:hypothetical protein
MAQRREVARSIGLRWKSKRLPLPNAAGGRPEAVSSPSRSENWYQVEPAVDVLARVALAAPRARSLTPIDLHFQRSPGPVIRRVCVAFVDRLGGRSTPVVFFTS